MTLQSFSLKILTISLLLISTTESAIAGNYKGESSTTVPYVQKGLRDGLYLGGQVGYDWYKVKENIPITAPIDSFNENANGWVGGLLLGYGKYFNQLYYLGGEIFGNYSGANENHTYQIDPAVTFFYKPEASIRASYGLALLPGIKLTDNILGYVRLGYNWAQVSTKQTVFLGSVPLTSTSDNSTTHGFNYGLGVEMSAYDNWSVRAEYSRTNYKSFSVTSTNSDFKTKFTPTDNQFMLGVIYHFV